MTKVRVRIHDESRSSPHDESRGTPHDEGPGIAMKVAQNRCSTYDD